MTKREREREADARKALAMIRENPYVLPAELAAALGHRLRNSRGHRLSDYMLGLRPQRLLEPYGWYFEQSWKEFRAGDPRRTKDAGAAGI